MMVLVTYDVCTTDADGAKRLRRISRACQNYGQRVQHSVFEIEVDPAQWTALKHKLETIFNAQLDSLRYYYLGSNWLRRVEHVGAKPSTDLNGPMII
ncbi:MAG: CRISPR-associated endonuclease Cas2 [Alphaproteobacteria bacterium]|nr:MAG: CRISPR-associated endonuclease Cas2 [Alphaproteobacteria bacterium]